MLIAPLTVWLASLVTSANALLNEAERAAQPQSLPEAQVQPLSDDDHEIYMCETNFDCPPGLYLMCGPRNVCICIFGYAFFGDLCYPKSCLQYMNSSLTVCGGPAVGTCDFAAMKCRCYDGYSLVGTGCVYAGCVDPRSGLACNNHGSCEYIPGSGDVYMCACEPIYGGITCSTCMQFTDPLGECINYDCMSDTDTLVCGGGGTCVGLQVSQGVWSYHCVCTSDQHVRVGNTCAPASCVSRESILSGRPTVCSNRGSCEAGRCVCEVELNVYGDTCEKCLPGFIRSETSCDSFGCVSDSCSRDNVVCSGIGTCVTANMSLPICNCPQGFKAVGPECLKEKEGSMFTAGQIVVLIVAFLAPALAFSALGTVFCVALLGIKKRAVRTHDQAAKETLALAPGGRASPIGPASPPRRGPQSPRNSAAGKTGRSSSRPAHSGLPNKAHYIKAMDDPVDSRRGSGTQSAGGLTSLGVLEVHSGHRSQERRGSAVRRAGNKTAPREQAESLPNPGGDALPAGSQFTRTRPPEPPRGNQRREVKEKEKAMRYDGYETGQIGYGSLPGELV